MVIQNCRISISNFDGSDEKMKDMYTLRGIVHSYRFDDECEATVTGIHITDRREHLFGIDYILKKCKQYGLQVEVK